MRTDHRTVENSRGHSAGFFGRNIQYEIRLGEIAGIFGEKIGICGENISIDTNSYNLTLKFGR